MNYDKTFFWKAVLGFACIIVFSIPFACQDIDDFDDGFAAEGESNSGEDLDDDVIVERAANVNTGCEDKCSSSCKCGWTEIGCKNDSGCQSGLYCKMRPNLGNRCLKKATDNNNDNDKDNDNNNDNCHTYKPGHGSYCNSSCKCEEGEGDCDKDADCKSGLVCKQQSGTDFCEKPGSKDDDDDDGGGGGGDAKSNLQVKLSGKWKGVCCNGGELEISGGNCSWKESGRVLKTKDLRNGNSTALNCPENNQRPKDCNCTGSGERMHGISANGSVAVANSLKKSNGAPIYPNSKHETCIDLVGGELQSRWTKSSTCPSWRLVNFY